MTRFAAIALAAIVTLTATSAQAAALTEVKGGIASASIASFGPFEQSFVPTEDVLTGFAFTFGSTSRTSTGSVIFSLLDKDGNTLVQAQKTDLTGLVFRGLGGFVDVFAGTVAVTAGQTYRARLTSDSSNVALGYGNDANRYEAGTLTRANNSDQACVRTPNPCDANFRFTTAAAAVVPEPATWALMFTGFALVGGAARYRRRASVLRYN